MPFKNVVENKCHGLDGVLKVLEGVTVEMIEDYLKTAKIRKVISTYNGLQKLLTAYQNAGLNIYDEFVLVDEWQVLYSQYKLRSEAFKLLINETGKFKSITFMSATPIEKKYWFQELKRLEEVELVYEIEQPVIRHQRVNHIKAEAIDLCKSYLHKEENAHIFCNSVDFIKDVVENADLKPDRVRIVCSDTRSNNTKIGNLNGFEIGSTLDPVKKINFYTSTCFEGADLFDKKGNIFVFADGAREHTLIDITTTLPQIAGRIRDIEDNSVNLIYRTTRHNPELTFEEYAEVCQRTREKALRLMRLLNQDEVGIAYGIKTEDQLNGEYLTVSNGKIEFDEMFLFIDELAFKIRNVYSKKVNVIAALNSDNRFIPVTILKTLSTTVLEANSHRKSFKEKIEAYHQLKLNKFHIEGEVDKTVKEAYEVLGFD